MTQVQVINNQTAVTATSVAVTDKGSRPKRIGILAGKYAHSSKKDVLGIPRHYQKFFQQFGKVYMVMPDQSPGDMELDLLVLPGGPDVSSALQSTDGNYPTGQGNDMAPYTYFFKHQLSNWVNSGIAVFGICLGMQALNVHFGGTLTSDGFGHSLGLNQYHPVITVNVTETGLFRGLPHGSLVDVTSRHHQFVRADNKVQDIADCLRPVAYGFHSGLEKVVEKMKLNKISSMAERLAHTGVSTYTCCVEAFVHENLPVAGVQWHPEDVLLDTYEHGDSLAIEIVETLLNR